MTIHQTRQLGIEFERRVLTILPATESSAKLDSETIYSFLNLFLQKYVLAVYDALSKGDGNFSVSNKTELILSCLFRHKTLTQPSTTIAQYSGAIRAVVYTVPKDYCKYIRSISKVDSTYNWSKKINEDYTFVTNTFENQVNIFKLLETSHNKLRILRNPIAAIVLKKDSKWFSNIENIEDFGYTLCVIHDRYTHIVDTDLCYYKMPAYFDIMTSTPCELPMDCFEDLVAGAVELYIGYVRGGIRQQEEDGRMDRFNRRHAQREAEQNQEE